MKCIVQLATCLQSCPYFPVKHIHGQREWVTRACLRANIILFWNSISVWIVTITLCNFRQSFSFVHQINGTKSVFLALSFSRCLSGASLSLYHLCAFILWNFEVPIDSIGRTTCNCSERTVCSSLSSLYFHKLLIFLPIFNHIHLLHTWTRVVGKLLEKCRQCHFTFFTSFLGYRVDVCLYRCRCCSHDIASLVVFWAFSGEFCMPLDNIANKSLKFAHRHTEHV